MSVRLTGNNKVYEHLNDAVLDSLCPKDSGEIFHKTECLNRIVPNVALKN